MEYHYHWHQSLRTWTFICIVPVWGLAPFESTVMFQEKPISVPYGWVEPLLQLNLNTSPNSFKSNLTFQLCLASFLTRQIDTSWMISVGLGVTLGTIFSCHISSQQSSNSSRTLQNILLTVSLFTKNQFMSYKGQWQLLGAGIADPATGPISFACTINITGGVKLHNRNGHRSQV